MLSEGFGVAYISGRTRLNGDITDIVKDLKAGIRVLKNEITNYGYSEFIVSGGHLAQLVAYTDQMPLYTENNMSLDTTVDGVVSFYGTSDLRFDYDYFTTPENRNILDCLGDFLYSKSATEGEKNLQESNRIMTHGVLGGPPGEDNNLYDMSASINLVTSDAPKTLLILGTHDSMTPIEADYILFEKLSSLGCDVTFLKLPFVDHAFDSLMNEDSIVVDKAFEETMRWLLANFD